MTQLLPLLDALPSIGGERGQCLREPRLVQVDRGYDSQPFRDLLHARGIRTQIG